MPICTSCTHPTVYLYTVYNTANNLRLEQCSACQTFADPYVEHDTLTLLLDLILLKRDVYRHLLFNRGAGVRYLGTQKSEENQGEKTESPTAKFGRERTRERQRWIHILKLGAILILLDAFIRWSHLGVSRTFEESEIDLATWNTAAILGFLRIVVGCIVETIAFHGGVTAASYLTLSSLEWINKSRRYRSRNHKSTQVSGIRQEFRYSHVPLTLLYSSLTKLFLLFLLTIWKPEASSTKTARPLLPQYNASQMFSNQLILGAIEILDEGKMDREWVVRNVLGGMAAGFGLRVVLDCHPAFTTLVVLSGWGVKTFVARVMGSWVGMNIGVDDGTVGEVWLAYSIP